MNSILRGTETLRIATFKDSHATLIEALQAEGVEFDVLRPPMGVAMASAMGITAVVSAALVKALQAWLSYRSKRVLNVQFKDGRIAMIKSQGLSGAEIGQAVKGAAQIVAIDPPDKA